MTNRPPSVPAARKTEQIANTRNGLDLVDVLSSGLDLGLVCHRGGPEMELEELVC